jgi:hypothetical protein
MNGCRRFGLDSAQAGTKKGGPGLRPDLRVLSGLGRNQSLGHYFKSFSFLSFLIFYFHGK